MKKKLISLSKIEYTYNPGTPIECPALRGIDFDVYSGEIVSLIGHTGSGKSTLIQLLNGQRKPDSGEIFWHNMDIFDKTGKMNLRKLCACVGMVFQYPEDQVFEETVYADIAFGPKQLGFAADKVEEIVFKVADIMGIGRELLQMSPFELSGGTLRKVAIAGVLAMEPKVLVLDEPLAGLDPKSCDSLSELLRQLRECLDIAIVMVSHNLEYVADLSDRVYCIENGAIELSGTARDVFSNVMRLAEIRVGSVPSAVLANMLVQEGFIFDELPVCVDDLTRGLLKNYGK